MRPGAVSSVSCIVSRVTWSTASSRPPRGRGVLNCLCYNSTRSCSLYGSCSAKSEEFEEYCNVQLSNCKRMTNREPCYLLFSVISP